MVITKKQLISQTRDVLRKYQFHGNEPLWNRDYAEFVDVIELQISKSKDMFAINVGVADKFVMHACWGLDIAGMVDEPSCTVRARLGELLYGRDVWWSLSDCKAIEEVLRGIHDVAIPFLQFNHHIDHMIEYLEKDPATRRYPPGIIYLALLHYRKGENDRCREMFRSMNLTGAWSKKASDILEALD
jgi:hypothetical protein